MNMRIVRTIVLLAAVTYFMPSPPEDQFGSQGNPPVTELVSAAVSTVADMSDFCGRQSAVCDTAHYLAVKLEGKAKYSIELLYQWAHESNDLLPPEQALDSTGAGAHSQAAAANDTGGAGHNTLQLEDLIPEWRAPARQS